MLNSCDKKKCIDADDFGFPKFTIGASYPAWDITGIKGAQVAKWIDSGYSVNGENLIILVKNWKFSKEIPDAPVSAWCPWYGTKEDGNNLAKICKHFKPCKFIEGDGTKFYSIQNPPCLMTKGAGLYALINPPKSPNPNITIQTQRIPEGATRHAGIKQDFPLQDFNLDGYYEDAGGMIWSDYDRNLIGGKLYFKILDNYYENNSGQYSIVIKSGVLNQEKDPLQHIIELVKNRLFGDNLQYKSAQKTSGDISIKGTQGFIEKIYKNIAAKSGFRKFVMALLTLYVMSFGFLYLMGLVQINHQELLSRVLKIMIVSVLLTETSWSFFYNNFFILFIEGPSTIISWLNRTTTAGGGSSIINLMMSHETLAKLFSLLFVSWGGWVFIIIYFLLFIFILFVLIKASITYLTALIMTSIIILTAPIFMCFMLFNFTKNFFDNWLKQLISYSIQPIILFAGIAFISTIIRHEIYATLGFKVCQYKYSFISCYYPFPKKGEDFNKKKRRIYVPEDHEKTDTISSNTNEICHSNPKLIQKSKEFYKAYESIEERFVDLPFLDPNSPSDCDTIKKFFNGDFIHWHRFIILSIAVFLLYYFNATAISISKFIANTGKNFFSLGDAGRDAYEKGEKSLHSMIPRRDANRGSRGGIREDANRDSSGGANRGPSGGANRGSSGGANRGSSGGANRGPSGGANRGSSEDTSG